ncbi:GNAT family N-acetyltransferase [Nakamurella lactea]|uniref:GNAT family N-acetyltransferase n=1 Tax=Nakamurella lactea TaxID=459515 RepID=UPI00041C377D|nr:GNAT family N-acetyltransferase [Nakamurella lactea]
MVSTPEVRAAQPDDALAFATCHLACWREAYGELWGQERFAEMDVEKMARRRRQEIEDGTATHVLAEADGEVVAVAISGPSRDEDDPAPQELYASYVRKAYQGSGVADALLAATIGDRPAALWVYRDNPRATAFYVNHGFIPDGSERTDSEGILEIRMVRNGGRPD